MTTVQKLLPRSQAAWAAFRARLNERGATLLEPTWLGATVKHRAACSEGHTCYPIPHKIQKGHRVCLECPRPESVAAWEKFRIRVGELGGEILDTEWRGNRQTYAVRCADGHLNQIWPIGLHQDGRGICRRCAGKSPESAWEKFRAHVEQLGGVVLEATWKGCTEPHECLCPQGHHCTPQPTSVMRGQGLCRTCANRDPVAAREAFLARVRELGGVPLELDTWKGVVRAHAVRCREGHITAVRPVLLSQGGRLCTQCPSPRTLRAEAEFKARVAELGGTLHEERWLGWDRGHSATCPVGHVCSPIPVNVSAGKGICTTCVGKIWDVLYVVTGEAPDLVKVGITSGDPRPRLADHRRDGLDQVVRLLVGLPVGVAPRAERAVLAALRNAGEAPVRGREYFPGRALDLVLSVVDGWVTAA